MDISNILGVMVDYRIGFTKINEDNKDLKHKIDTLKTENQNLKEKVAITIQECCVVKNNNMKLTEALSFIKNQMSNNNKEDVASDAVVAVPSTSGNDQSLKRRPYVALERLDERTVKILNRN